MGLLHHRPILFFRLLARRQIEHEGDALPLRSIEHRGRDQNRHTAVVLAEILLFERPAASGRPERNQRHVPGGAPCRGRHAGK